MSTTPQRIVWEEEATKCLIEARRQADPEFRANKRTKPIWERVAQYLNAKGHYFTLHQCHVKWKNLLRDYRLTKQHNANIANEPKEMQAGTGLLALMDEFLDTSSPMISNGIWRLDDDESTAELGSLMIPPDAVITRPTLPTTGPTPIATPNTSPVAKQPPRKRVAVSSSSLPATSNLMCVTIHTKKKSPYKSNVIVTKGMTFKDLLNHVFPGGPPSGKRFTTRTGLDDSSKEFLPDQVVESLVGAKGHADLWVNVEEDNVDYDELF